MSQPLKINVDEVTVTQVTNTLQTRHDQEEAMKNVFQSARIFAQNEINDHLTDFRSKRALGRTQLSTYYIPCTYIQIIDACNVSLMTHDHVLWGV